MEKPVAEFKLDLSKMKISPKDEERAIKNNQILKSLNVPYLENMKMVPRDCDTTLLPKEKYLKSMLRDLFFALLIDSIFEYPSSYDKVCNEVFDFMEKRYSISNFFSEEDKKLFLAIKNKKVDNNTLMMMSWLYEDVAIYGYVLNFFDKPKYNSQCDMKELFGLLVMDDKINYKELQTRATLRSKDEILDYADLVTRMSWSAIESRQQNMENPIPYVIVSKQQEVFNKILNFDPYNYCKPNSLVFTK